MLTGHDARRRPRTAAPAEMAEEPRPACPLRGPAGGPVLARATLAQSPAADQVGRGSCAAATRGPAEHRQDAPRLGRPFALGGTRADVLPDKPRRFAARRTLCPDRGAGARAPAREDARAEAGECGLDLDSDRAEAGAAP